MLELRFIGRFEICCDGEPVVVSSRIAQSLLAYLILTGGTQHRREKLAGMFWPNATEGKARAYLRHELWRIRKALSKKSKVDYLIADDINISFNASSDYCSDTATLQHLSESASIEELMNALSVYPGEFLPGFYEEWITQEREHFLTICDQRMSRLLELLENEKRWYEILDWSERWMSFDNTIESAYRYLMVAYDALGDRAKVTSTYQRCVQALHDLGLAPSELTRTLAFKRSSNLNIPIPLTSFIGREIELKEVTDLLTKSRLVTLTGSGGVGKTRLAIQVIAELIDKFPDGVWFLDLAPLRDPSLVPNTLTSLLGLREPPDLKLSITDLLKDYLRSRIALIIFDNCEHLIESCAHLVDSLLQSCDGLDVLATSREALRVSGEVPYRVPSLEIPKRDIESVIDTLAKTESVRLFMQRATVASPSFVIDWQTAPVIAQICQRLDGIPLAIELAAARANMLTVDQILKRLDDRFNLLTSGLRTALPRHQTLRATIDWSYALLTENERLLFMRLSVFRGGWTLEAAESICSGKGIESPKVLDLLSQLVNKSLESVENTGDESRYQMLETIRHYALQMLIESGEEEYIRNRHLEYFLQLSEQADSALKGPLQIGWFARLNDEHDNIRAALEWADKTDVEAGLYLSGRLHRYWEDFDMREGTHWLAEFLEKPESKSYSLARAKALLTQTWMAHWAHELGLAHLAAQECLDLYRACGDKLGEIDGLLAVGISNYNTWNVENMELYQQALDLSKFLGDQWRQAQALVHLSWSSNDYDRCVSYREEAVVLFKKVGDLELSTSNMISLGNVEMVNGNLRSAQKWLDEAVKASQNLDNKWLKADILDLSGCMSLIRGDYERARTDLKQAMAIAEDLGNKWNLLWARARLGYVALREGNMTEARNIFVDTAQIFQKDQFADGVLFTLEGIASLSIAESKHELAALLIGWADATRKAINETRPILEQADIDQIIAACLTKIGQVAFSKAYDEGKKLTLDEAVANAIEGVKGI